MLDRVPCIFKRCPNILITKLYLLFQLSVSHDGLARELVVVNVEFYPLAGFLCKRGYACVELVLALAEDVNIFSLSLFFVCLQLSFVHFFAEWLEGAACLSHNYGSEDEVVLEFESAI